MAAASLAQIMATEISYTGLHSEFHSNGIETRLHNLIIEITFTFTRGGPACILKFSAAH